MYYRQRQQPESALGTHGFNTEVAGRDRVRFFRRPVEPGNIPHTYTDINTVRFTSTAPAGQLPLDEVLGSSVTGRRKAHHLPALNAAAPHGSDGGGGGSSRPIRSPFLSSSVSRPRRAKPSTLRDAKTTPTEDTTATARGTGTREAGMQTVYRENDAQTDPYTPAYVIPQGGDPNPEVLGLGELYWKDGLPAGMEEIELIGRLRRRRAIEAMLPVETDAKSAEIRHRALFALEEKELEEREEHIAKLRQRRLDAIGEALTERERGREEANRVRLEAIKAQKLADLRRVLERTEARRLAMGLGVRTKSATLKAEHAAPSAVDPLALLPRRRDLIGAYAKYGTNAAPPLLPHTCAGGTAVNNSEPPATTADHFRHYDVRPALLGISEGIEELEEVRIPRKQRLPKDAFVPPENYAINSLPTLYQRREAKRVTGALDYVHAKIHKSDVPSEKIRVLELYRAAPRLQRPDTPELELEGDADEQRDEACVLLQRLLRGRAVQNDFFDGKERCRGLIEELQAASNAKYAERSATVTLEEEEARRREAVADSVIDGTQGDIIIDTLDYLFNELTRQQDHSTLEHLRREAETMRELRETKEAELRVKERIMRDKQDVQYAAYLRGINDVVQCYAHDLYTTAAEECGMEEAIRAEKERRRQLRPVTSLFADALDAENTVCDMLDNFVLPAVVDMVLGKTDELELQAQAGVAAEVPTNDEEKEDEVRQETRRGRSDE